MAVVLDAEELETGTMQRFARWTNLSGTTFPLPAQDPTYAIKAAFTVDQLADTWAPYFTWPRGCASPPACSATRCRRPAVPDRTRNGADSRAEKRSGRWAVGALAAMVLCCSGHALLVAGALGGASALVGALATDALVVGGGLLLLTGRRGSRRPATPPFHYSPRRSPMRLRQELADPSHEGAGPASRLAVFVAYGAGAGTVLVLLAPSRLRS